MAKFQSKNTILTKKLNNVIYELMVKTKAEMVYTDDDTTLTEKLSDIVDVLTTHNRNFEEVMEQINTIVQNAETLSSDLEEIWTYVNVNGDPKSALIELIEGKQEAEDGKGLSECDFTEVLKEKLENGYSKEELDNKFKIIIDDIDNRSPEGLTARVEKLENAPTATLVTDNEADAKTLKDKSIWYKIVKDGE
jgi:hypothetical protein